MALLLATAYAPPIEYMAYLYTQQGTLVFMEAYEHIVKQSWRNRCDILTANGIQSLTIPIERPSGGKTRIKDIRISEHGNWRHLHSQALRSSYGSSPYFEYYWDDLSVYYDKRYHYLWDYNWEMLHLFSRLIDLELDVVETEYFLPVVDDSVCDIRYKLHPRLLNREASFLSKPYYQTFSKKFGFVSQLSIYDLLMNMGPESLLYLRDLSKELCIE